MPSPLVSVVIPTHNRPAMLAEALASVGAQTFTDYEILVVSNGESAEMRRASRDVVAGHHCRHGARPCAYFTLAKGNLPAARNFAIALAEGEWIALLDDDDLWLPQKLNRQVAEAEGTGADMIASDYIEFHPDGRDIIRQPRLLDGWSYTKALGHGFWCVAPSTVMVRKRVFAEIGSFDVHQRYSEDVDMWRRISWRHGIHHVEEALVRYRSGHLSMLHPRYERMRYLYDLRHFVKMRRDTPCDLRSALPSAAVFMFPRLVGICSPRWLLTFLHWFGPRRRWLNFRHWLNSRLRRGRGATRIASAECHTCRGSYASRYFWDERSVDRSGV